jgi:hypothetical protein
MNLASETLLVSLLTYPFAYLLAYNKYLCFQY